MKKYSPLFVLALAALLAGCASSSQHRQAPSENDTRYMNAIESTALQVGVEVHWVNPPRKQRVNLDYEG